MVSIVRGDLLEAAVPYICQQVNCQGVMGAGLARQIKDKWPHVYERYRELCEKKKQKQSLLGTVQIVNGRFGSPTVINIFGQFEFGHNGVYTDYSALTRAFNDLNKRFAGKTLAFPYGFGCGLAGGEWTDVEMMMVKLLPNCDVQIYMKG